MLDGRKQRSIVPVHYADMRKGSLQIKRLTARQLPAADRLAYLPPAPEVEVRPLSSYDLLLEVVR